jgi:hypothetical protein
MLMIKEYMENLCVSGRVVLGSLVFILAFVASLADFAVKVAIACLVVRFFFPGI